jgi:hypothetical protein
VIAYLWPTSKLLQGFAIAHLYHLLTIYKDWRLPTYDHLYNLTPKIPWDQNWSIAVRAVCVKKNNFFSIFPFRWVNYIFHKLSVNTKHAQFRLRMSPWLKIGIKLIFHIFSKDLLHAAMWLKLPKGWKAGFSKNSLFCP